MPDCRPWRGSILASAVLLLVAAAVRAEVSTDPTTGGVNTLTLGIVDDSDPISVMWQPFRSISPERILNPSGHARGDGRPDLAFQAITDDPDPVPGSPVVVWAYNAGTDFDIAFSEWDGTQWTAIAFLTASLEDESDPRLFVEPNGAVHVVWWTAGEEVYLVTRQAGSSTWGSPEQVTQVSEGVRRPSIIVHDGVVTVAFETSSATPGMAQDVVVATRPPGGGFTYAVIGSTVRTDALDVMLHQEQGHVWADWKHEAAEFGSAEYLQGTGWSTGPPASWTDPSWIGVEETRRVMRRQILD